jgi:hypothetical protein
VSWVVAAVLLLAAEAAAQTTAALVLEVSGAVSPAVRPYAEVPADLRVTLPEAARIVFNHYGTCQVVTVVGGAVTVGAERYTVTGAQRESATRRPCLKRIRLTGSGDVGGIVLRSPKARPALSLGLRPTFVLVGPRADAFQAVRVARGGKTVFEGRLEGAHFRWPASAIPLVVGQDYELVLLPRPGGAEVKTPFRAVGDLAEDTPTLLDVDRN